MTDQAGIFSLGNPAQGWREFAININEKVTQVIVGSADSILCGSRAPDQTIQKLWKQCWCVGGQDLDNVGMSGKQIVHSIIVAIAVSSEDEKVVDNGLGCLKRPTFNR